MTAAGLLRNEKDRAGPGEFPADAL
jgi:hypothetical protein